VKFDERLEGFAVPVGTSHRPDGSCEFAVWAPRPKSVKLHLFGSEIDSGVNSPEISSGKSSDRYIEMERNSFGYFRATVADIPCKCRYMYRLELQENSHGVGPLKWTERPDPASRFQPEGVHCASQVVDLESFSWTDQGWKSPTIEQSIFYELHIGTYTPAGTLGAVVEQLPKLANLGVTTVELMPVAQFSGARNWGYDGVYPYAVQNTYGGPQALQSFVNAAHASGLAVALDVVYNHLGPEGNYLSDFGPYFTERYKTPWGQAINFDGTESEPVRRFFIDNAIHWFEKYHIDVLRLDAIHGIFDFSALPFLAELQERVDETSKRLGRELILVAESDLNDAKVLLPREIGGYGVKAQWSDDFHHSLHTLLTNERDGYYGDFGEVRDLAAVLKHGWLYEGQFSPFRRRRHGNPARGIPRSRFVVYSQNHDQVGNRASGERLSQLVNFEAQKLAAGVTLLSPFAPLLFMGEEYGETSPFLYFTDHADQDLIAAVRRGRRTVCAESGWQNEVSDPQSPATFKNSTLRHMVDKEPHRTLRRLYQTLLCFRRKNELDASTDWLVTEDEKGKTLKLIRTRNGMAIAIVFNFGAKVLAGVTGQLLELDPELALGRWSVALCSSDATWLGPGLKSGDELAVNDPIALFSQSFLVLLCNAITEGA
jgi:maltooligosyltrehalose trehalohydrolase